VKDTDNKVSKWIERKFEFPKQPGFCPNIRIRLRGTPARISDLLQHHSREVLILKPESKWSAQEHVGHLLDVEDLSRIHISDFLRCSNELTPPTITNRNTDEKNYNAQDIARVLSSFREARQATLDILEEIEIGTITHLIAHPRLKKQMRLVDYLYLVAEHDDHHLASIWQLVNNRP
jgi:DinB superfamily